ncbi:hypothetical protein PACTADRAFT_50248 [Pachysolen tannophilus NRRL Y-2460]|uniref:Conserved oligomeric Golgi complex subunit 8 n=1 Tax=Pachysolen tannophilus NRRL Y-2460 TaxID=669874 RepID=A0A1E4TV55_PACTA|nr:hypothetical protein PACTADRAFT_50248 [Pachysolen tannophilus NRRL Y-2460]
MVSSSDDSIHQLLEFKDGNSEDNLSCLQLLLDQLLDEEINDILNDGKDLKYREVALEYLNELCNGENSDFLTNAGSITMELAELENKETIAMNNLRKKCVSNVDLILSLNNSIENNVLQKYWKDFNSGVAQLHGKFWTGTTTGGTSSGINGGMPGFLAATSNSELAQSHNSTSRTSRNGSISAGASSAVVGDDEFNNFKSIAKNISNLLPLSDGVSNGNNNGSNMSLSVLLKNMDSIMDILELPSLTSACVKAGHYSESLEIAAHSRRLSIRYSDIKLITKIEQDINAEISSMIVGLIRLLKTDLKQSSILKIMSYLKRINPFHNESNDNNNDKELKLIFLQSRFFYIMNELNVLKPLKQSNSIEKYLKRCIEVIREYGFSTIITYENIFTINNENALIIGSTDFKNFLKIFITSIINELIKILKENLPILDKDKEKEKEKDNSIKENLLLQLLYCCNSLSRVGFDFSVLILENLLDNNIITKSEWLNVNYKKKSLNF